MASFLNVLFRNLLAGPSTDPFPAGPTFTPDRLRGKCVVDPDLCMGCGVCKNSCAAGAIDISPKEDKSGFRITIWRDSCCLCASCRHYCPTGAMSIVSDWHHVHEDKDKFEAIEQRTIDFEPCAHCGALIRPLPLKIAEKLYAGNKDIDPDRARRLCPKCRQLEDAARIENKKLAPRAEKTDAVDGTGAPADSNNAASVNAPETNAKPAEISPA